MTKKLYRSTEDAKVLGICGGIGEYFGVDSTLIRIIVFVVMISTSIFPGLVAYLLLAIIIPKRPPTGWTEYSYDRDGNQN